MMLSQKKDDELMELLKGGNKMAFRELYDRHSKSVFGYCMAHCSGNRALSEDIQQDVWMKVIKASGRYEGKGQFKAWLMTITRNTSYTQLGKQLKLHDDSAEAEAQIPSGQDLELDFVHMKEGEAVQAAIQALPEAQRTVLLLWLGEELSYDEMAAATGLSEPSVRSLLFRAKKSLKEKLERK